ncbi:MAG: hypothetical protein AAF481_12105 [Acidobacteriota bacterium]
MTRILVWNVSTFGILKIEDPSTKRARGTSITHQEASEDRFELIQRVFGAAMPDIIVIVEVASGDSFPNALATPTDGILGANRLLTFLRGDPAFRGGDWRLVPPLRIGRSNGSKPETVAVLYRGVSDGGVTRYFTGPNVWTGGYAGASIEPLAPATAAAQAQPYPGAGAGYPDLNAMLVPPGSQVREIPRGALYNGRLDENTVAARTDFREDDRGVPSDNYLNFGPYRPPYMVTFTEVAGGNVSDLTLFGVHSPAVAGDPEVFLSYLASVYDVVSPLNLAETRVVCGDFNVRLLDVNGNYTGAYDALTAHDYEYLLRPPAGGPPNPLDGYTTYFGTHLRQGQVTKASRFLWSDDANLSYYPGYRYFGSQRGANLSSLDNILVRPYDAANPAAFQMSVINPVVGSPLNRINPPTGNAPEGTIGLASQFRNPVGFPPAPPVAAPNYVHYNIAYNLTNWDNYEHIYSTSDHLALFAVIP